MEGLAPSQSDHLIPMSADTEINSVLEKIEAKLKEVKELGLTLRDQKILKSRLNSIWNENEVPVGNIATIWRKTRSRQIYHMIQDKDSHLFLAMVLVVAPTDCAKTRFDKVVEHLIHLESFEACHLSLNPAARAFFESTATACGYSGSRAYLDFMAALFPQGELSPLTHE